MDGYTDVPDAKGSDFEPTPIYDKVKEEAQEKNNDKKK